ncbi:MAG: hypothetical protein FWE08_06775 [Oscillospiraceae bacterium]|nr:hypothetical protein [Oscillospiraceae bacterium]
MFVRVFDSQRNIYFKSEVYAIINSGWYEKRLVVFSTDDGSYFKFFDYIDKSDPKHKVLINTITSNGFGSTSEWIRKDSNDVDKKLEEYARLPDDIRFFEYKGHAWIYENISLLTKLLKGDMVSTKGYKHQIFTSNARQSDDWNYVDKQQDIDFILEQTGGFHDSVLKKLDYISGSYVDDKNQMYCMDNIKQVSMWFDSQWCRPIEMVFESVIALNLRPYSDNETSFLFDAALFVQNETIFFFDSRIDAIDRNYDGTWIEAYGLRWRFCD